MTSKNDNAWSRIIGILAAIPGILATGVAHGQLIAPSDPSGMSGGIVTLAFAVIAVLTAFYVSLVV